MSDCAESCPFVIIEARTIDKQRDKVNQWVQNCAGVKKLFSLEPAVMQQEVEILGSEQAAIQFHADPDATVQSVRQGASELIRSQLDALLASTSQVITMAIDNIESAQSQCDIGPSVTKRSDSAVERLICQSNYQPAAAALLFRQTL